MINKKKLRDNYWNLEIQEVSEEKKQSPKKKQMLEPKQPKVSLATQKIFTDEDFAKIRERREQREIERLAGINSSKKVSNESDDEEFIDVSKIMAHTKKKNDYEARLQSIKVLIVYVARKGR